MANNRDIQVVSEFEYVQMRPEIYVGSVMPTAELMPIIQNGSIEFDDIEVSVGAIKLFSEIFDNSVDACIRAFNDNKRFRGRVGIIVDDRDNSITISDNAYGFHNALAINDKTETCNIKTAFTELRSGTNFSKNSDDYLIGLNGVGGTLVNMLSEKFTLKSISKDSRYENEWIRFEDSGKEKTKKGKFVKTGTTVCFIPRRDIFCDHDGVPYLYDHRVLYSKVAFSKKCIDISNHPIDYSFKHIDVDGITHIIKISTDFTFEDSWVIDKPGFVCHVYFTNPKIIYMDDVLVVNTTLCKSGSPLRYIRKMVAKKMKIRANIDPYFHVMIFMKATRELMSFGDQNKTIFTTSEKRITPYIEEMIGNSFNSNKLNVDNDWLNLRQLLSHVINRKSLNKIAKDSKIEKKWVSDKFFPSVKNKDIFIVEGLSALGGILQGRNGDQAMYALQGVINNCRTPADISASKELTTLIGLVNLKFERQRPEELNYERIVIACDADHDGAHIIGLLIFMFSTWFPHVIENGLLYRLLTPIGSVPIKGGRKYIYSQEDKEKHESTSGFLYYKGLGSLRAEDWEILLSPEHIKLQRFVHDSTSKQMLDVVFQKDPKPRKKWLANKITIETNEDGNDWNF